MLADPIFIVDIMRLKMSKIQEKITVYMDQIQAVMESNTHLEENSQIHSLISSVSIYFAHMYDEDKDYYQAVQHALEEKKDWNLKKDWNNE